MLDKIKKITNELFGHVFEADRDLIVSVCQRSISSDMSEDEIREKIKKINVEFKASTPYDDDCYWMIRSPFNNKYYIFAQSPYCSGAPSEPVFIKPERPDWFDED